MRAFHVVVEEWHGATDDRFSRLPREQQTG